MVSGMQNDRRFDVETPLGKLLADSKQRADGPEMYPGVYEEDCI